MDQAAPAIMLPIIKVLEAPSVTLHMALGMGTAVRTTDSIAEVLGQGCGHCSEGEGCCRACRREQAWPCAVGGSHFLHLLEQGVAALLRGSRYMFICNVIESDEPIHMLSLQACRRLHRSRCMF